VCGTSISSVSHCAISGELRNCDLRNYGAWRGPKGPSLPLPRTEARLTRAENGRPDGCQKEIPGRRPPPLADSAQIGLGTDRSQRREERTNETMPKCPNGRGLSPRVRRYPTTKTVRPRDERSISACAEVPPSGGAATSSNTVYLRVCGGTLRYSVRKGHRSAGKRTACLEKCNRYWACRRAITC